MDSNLLDKAGQQPAGVAREQGGLFLSAGCWLLTERWIEREAEGVGCQVLEGERERGREGESRTEREEWRWRERKRKATERGKAVEEEEKKMQQKLKTRRGRRRSKEGGEGGPPASIRCSLILLHCAWGWLWRSWWRVALVESAACMARLCGRSGA